jgi:hypothetical protein
MPAFFPAISRTLERSEDEIHESLLDVRRRLSEELFEEYLLYLERIHSGDVKATSFGRWYLHQYCLFAGYLQAFFTCDEKTVFTFGAEILPWDSRATASLSPDLTAEGPGALLYLQRQIQKREHRLGAAVVLPARMERLGRNLLDHEILPFAQNLFLYMPGLGDPRRVNQLEVLNQRVLTVLQEELQKGQQVTLSHFKFQDLHIYLEMQGEHRTREILRGIIDYIHGNLKQKDLLVQLTPLSYIMISPGATGEQILERFRSIYFQIRSLVLEYQIHLTTISQPPIRLPEIWKELRL